MRIDYIAPSTLPSRAANSVHVMRMCEAMAGLGHAVTLFAYRGGAASGAPGSPDTLQEDLHAHYGVAKTFSIVHPFRPRLRLVGGALYMATLAARLSRRAPDLYYGRELEGMAVVSHMGRPFVLETHAPPSTPESRAMLRFILASPMLRRVVVISEALKAIYLERYPHLAGALVVAHDAANDPGEPEAWAAQAEVADARRLHVGYVGSLYSGRGIGCILELARAFPQADFHVVGGAPEDVARVAAQQVSPNVTLHGHMPPALLGPLYRRFDVTLAPYQRAVAVSGGAHGKGDSSRWMSPLKIFESMAYGKAMVVSDFPVLREVLRHGENALLAPPEDMTRWREALGAVLADAALRRRLGRQARADFLANHTWRRRAETTLAGLTP